jgi:hypothetical protein
MMSATLQARLRARERNVEVGGHVYTIRRPKPAEMLTDQSRMDLVCRFVVGWDLKNNDLVPGGTPDPEPFEAALFADWVEDDASLWQPLAEAILADWAAYVAAKEAAAKN